MTAAGGSDGAGRVALLTGASSGIGAATARALARQGTTVGLVARRTDRLEEVLADCLPHAPRSRAWPADLADPDAAADLALEIWDALGHLDLVINNAGIPMRRPVPKLTMDEIRRVMDVNYFSPVAIILALLPRLLAQGHGTVVNVSSVGGRLGIPTEAAYSASKFALCGWTEAMAVDLAHTGINVKLVLPGAIDTEIWDQPGNDPPVYEGPLMPAEEFADALLVAIDSDQVEHYLPDMKPVVEMKTSDFDGFMAGMVAMAHPPVAESAGSADRTESAERAAAGDGDPDPGEAAR